MYLSSSGCLRKIKEGVCDRNFSVDDQEIKEACIMCNFNVNKAIQLLIDREEINESILQILEEKKYCVSTNMVKRVCKRYNYNYDKIKIYLIRFGYTKKMLKIFLNENNIYLDDNILENEINMCSGFYKHTVSNIQLKYCNNTST